MNSGIVRVFVVLAALQSLPLAAAKPTPPIEVRVAAPQVVRGGTVAASVDIQFLTDVESIRLTVRGRGALESHPSIHVLRGPWAAGERYAVPWRMVAAHDGEGSLVATVEALDGAENVRFSRTGELLALVDEDRLWTSPSSPTDLQFRRIEELARLGTLSEDQRSEMQLSLSTARVAADHDARPTRTLTATELKIERAFAPAALEPQPRTPRTESAVTMTVHGQVQWTDRNGTRHGLPMATVEIRDAEVIGSDLIQTVRTNAAGNYTATFTHDDGVLQGNPDIFVRVLAKSPVAEIKPDELLASTYQLESPVDDEVTDGSNLTVNLTAGNVNDNETAFSIHHALVVIGAYAGNVSGATPSMIVTRFPTTRSTSMFTGSQLHILRQDRWDWDVLHHEYGHYVMAIHGFQNNPGGPHNFNDNLAQSRGSKDVGVRLAWGEGWPTFFGLSGQRAMGAAALGVPDVGDVSYQDTEDASVNLNAESSTGLGEDNEVSVIAALFDLHDSAADGADVLSFGDRTLFQAFKGSGATTVGAAWNSIATANDARTRTLIGGLLAQSKIAPELTQPADNTVLRASGPVPTFRWKRNGGGTPNPLNDFKIVFYNEDFSSVLFEKEIGDTDQFTPTAAEIGTILSGSTPVKWLVQGRNTSTPATPSGSLAHYWSNARTIGGVSIAFVIDDTGSMSEEINGVKAALQQFINAVATRVPAGTAPPTIQLISFKDNVTSRIVSNDLDAIRTAVSGLSAGGGGDCPEFSAHALQFAASNIAPGGTILLATDASPQPGVDLGATIAGLRAKGVTVNTILSGDCSGIASRSGLFDSSQRAQSYDKPGGDDPSQPPVIDPGQPPVDDHGDELSTATLLGIGEPSVSGIVGAESGDVDFFAFSIAASTLYSIDIHVDEGADASFQLFDGEGTLVAQQVFNSGAIDHFVVTPPVDGVYSLRVTTSSSTPTRYGVAIRADAFAALTSAVEVFSTVSGQTGGTFLIRDGVNSGDTELYESALFNVMVSTLGPAVLSSEPTTVPQGTTLSLNLRGRNTNWRANSTVHFSGTGLEVLGITIHSATDLSATVRALPGALAGFRDVTVSTPLGTVETAEGQDVVEIVGAVSSPTLLSVEPATLSRGTTQNIRLRGANTVWGPSSTIALGTGIEVLSSQTVSATEITGQIRVDGDTDIGFRTAIVSTPSNGAQTRTRAVFIDSGIVALPVIASVSPDEGTPGTTFVVTVEGMNTNFQAGVTTASFGAGITVLQATVVDSDTAQVTIAIDAGATPGFRDVVLTTGSEVAVLLQGFFVTAPAATADVPTLPTLGLMLLGALLAVCALLVLRR